MNSIDKLNVVTRLVILLTLVGYMTIQNISILLLGFITLGIIVFMHYMKEKRQNKEGLTAWDGNEYNLSQPHQEPSKKNPLMNVMMNDYVDNPNKNPSNKSYDPTIVNEINQKTKENIIQNDKFKEKLFLQMMII